MGVPNAVARLEEGAHFRTAGASIPHARRRLEPRAPGLGHLACRGRARRALGGDLDQVASGALSP
jgi:hypothetical protein